jgi:N-methylhydantoinase B
VRHDPRELTGASTQPSRPPPPAAGATPDAFTLEILKDKLHAAADEMAVVLARTSMSPIVYEVLDFACGITDRRAQVVAQTNGLTLFTGTFGPQVEATVRKFGLESMRAGDVYMTNNPYEGGTHTCDVCLVRPILHGGELVAFAVAITHWIEIGGKVPGSISPDSTEIYQEGLQLPCVRLYREGELDEAILDIIRANVRLPLVAMGDVNASAAATAIGEQRVAEACERYGADALASAFDAILDHGEQIARAELRRVPNGTYVAEDVIDGDGLTDDLIPIRVAVTVTDDSLVADFTGTAPQTAGPVNCSTGALLSACKTVVRAITSPSARSNDGFFRPFELVVPSGTVFSAEPPAPTGWYYEASAFATELVWKALAPVVPDRLPSGSYASLCAAYIVGTDRAGEVFVLAEPSVGGWGAGADKDGENALIATTDGDTYNFPVEVAEARFPVHVERYELNADVDAGAGRRRGGLGVVREYRLLDVERASGYGSLGGWHRRPWSLAGGKEGSNNYLEYEKLDGTLVRRGRVAHIELEPGDRVRVVTGTGGGHGDPLEREPPLVLADVLDGYVSAAQARSVYGVAINEASGRVDEDETAALRARLGEPAR